MNRISDLLFGKKSLLLVVTLVGSDYIEDIDGYGLKSTKESALAGYKDLL